MKLPVRIDLIGGWSDQLLWKYPAAVVNAAITFDDKYPIHIGKNYEKILINGIGTGLGISSIRAAGHALMENPKCDYIAKSLEWESHNGTQGGWQDQMGAIEPGFKLITTDDHKKFTIKQLDSSLLDNVVLFDTGVRRPSKFVGDEVRRLFANDGFVSLLQEIVRIAEEVETYSYKQLALYSIECWQALDTYLHHDVKMPKTDLIYGYKLVGAGGGGFGIAFAKSDPDRVIRYYAKHRIKAWRVNVV